MVPVDADAIEAMILDEPAAACSKRLRRARPGEAAVMAASYADTQHHLADKA